jgi:hypothetical protein
MVLIVPHYVLDDELCGWLCNHFTELRIYNAADPTFKQVVIFGIRIRRQDLARPQEVKYVRARLQAIGAGTLSAEALPTSWPWEPYRVLPAPTELEHFYRISLEPEQLSDEVKRLRGMWPDFTLHFGQSGAQPRPPLRELSRWHLALALAAGAISGVVTSKTGRVLVLKGDTYKDKVRKTEFTEDQDGNVSEVRILTDRFVPIIRAWDMTPDSINFGKVITISSSADPQTGPVEPEAAPTPNQVPRVIFDPGRVLLTQSVQHLMEHGHLDPTLYLRRHFSGDWGELPEDDWNSNQRALTTGERLFSSYNVDAGDETRLWIITEADRSSTTVLLPSDY